MTKLLKTMTLTLMLFCHYQGHHVELHAERAEHFGRRAVVSRLTGETIMKPVLKLVGQNGNAFVLIGLAVRAAKAAQWSREEVAALRDACFNAPSYDALLGLLVDRFDVR